MLTLIRAVHSAIFLGMLGCIGWLVATGLTGRRDRSVAAAAVVVGIECAVWSTALLALAVALHVRWYRRNER